MAFSARTIFLFVRGVDQTGRMFTGLQKKIADLEKQQSKMLVGMALGQKYINKTELAVLKFIDSWDRAASRMIFAGAAFMAFGVMTAFALSKIIEKSSLGSLLMEDFSRVLEKFSTALSEQLIGPLGWLTQGIMNLIDGLSQDPAAMGMVANVAVIAGAFFIIGGPHPSLPVQVVL